MDSTIVRPISMDTCTIEESWTKSKLDEATDLFNVFILRVSQINEKHRLASKSFMGFQQELEELRQSPLQESSKLTVSLLKSHPTARTKKYQEAGYRHVHSDKKTISKLNGFIKGLNEHIVEARILINQLEELVVKVIALVDNDLDVRFDKSLIITSICQNKNDEDQDSCSEESILATWETSDYAIIMSIMLEMYEKDLQMQELIISDSRLDVDSECLQTYSQMWSLRPFIDDRVIHQLLKWAHKSVP